MHAPFDLAAFLLWCGLANYVLLMAAFLGTLWFRAPMRRIHQRWFALSDAQVDAYLYAFLGAWKIATWFFLLIPGGVLLAMR